MDSVSLARLEGCHAVVRERALALEPLLSFPYEVVQGKRTFNLQQAFYARGRQPLDAVNALYRIQGLAPLTEAENQVTVTRAKPGEGWHEYGLALDAAPFDERHKLDWTVAHPRWQELLAKAKAAGFSEGAAWRTFPDNPHLYPAELPASPDDAIRYAWREGGLDAVWRYVGETYNF